MSKITLKSCDAEAIKDIRGMSEPVFFAFNILKDKQHTLVAHGGLEAIAERSSRKARQPSLLTPS